ncbi:MAG TPA: hypothetical protein VOB72_18650 [Candidatus Dormibacteraeota bacterium]|nr:hypothetical protein [Candidatus Dormibacteraeota bacterium]
MFRNLARPPIVWFAAAEAALIAILAVVTWHVYVERITASRTASGGQVAAIPPAGPAPAPSGSGAGPVATPPARAPAVGPTPGIRTDANFLSRQLSELNRVEATFQDAEWRVTRAVVDAIQRYLEGVVLPSIERSERSQR